jgi:hypothetical protein
MSERKFDHDLIVRLWREGRTQVAIATQVGCSRRLVQKVIGRTLDAEREQAEAEKVAAEIAKPTPAPAPNIVYVPDQRVPGNAPALGRVRCMLTTDGYGSPPGFAQFLDEKDRDDEEMQRRVIERGTTKLSVLNLSRSDWLKQFHPKQYEAERARVAARAEAERLAREIAQREATALQSRIEWEQQKARGE